MFSYYLIQSEREAGASRAAHRAPLWQSRLCCVYPPLSHTLIRLSFSLIENPPQWHSIRAAEWKPGYFYIGYSFPRLGRGPSKGINHCSLTALPPGNDLSLFCAQKWHINLKMDTHKLYIQLLHLYLRSELSVKWPQCKSASIWHNLHSTHAEINVIFVDICRRWFSEIQQRLHYTDFTL